jgi:acetylornithine deacetylase/succinyl-diaminopimelate desuccinylase-like protein
MSLDGLRDRARTLDPEPIAELAIRMLELWTPPGGERPMAELAARALREAGADGVELDEEFAGSPSVIARLRGRRLGPTMQWHGHLDAIATPQGPVRREGDVIHGRGASDMKGAIAAMIEAVKLLRAEGLPDRGNVLITFHGLHETGGNVPLHRLIARGIHGDAVITGELGSGGELITSGRGLTFWDMIVRREGDSLHETNAAPGTVSPIVAGMRLVERLVALRDDLAAGRDGPPGTLFIGQFTSGDYYNRVPISAHLRGTRRHLAGFNLGQVRAQLEAIASEVATETGAIVEPQIHGFTEAYEVSPDTRVARALRLAHHDLTGEGMRVRASRAVGNASDFVREAGIPATYYGMAYATAHSDDEQLSVPELARVAGAYALATAYFLDDREEIDAPPLDESAG